MRLIKGNRKQGVRSSVQKLKKLAAFGAIAATAVLAGCRQDMQDEPKFFPQRGTSFYADGRSVRPQVANTMARNQLHEDSYFYTGLIDGNEGNGMPFPVTKEVLERAGYEVVGEAQDGEQAVALAQTMEKRI